MLTDNISRAPDGSLLFAGHSFPALGEEYGTPLYLMDEGRIRHNCRLYTETFRDCFGDRALPLYAGKAASFKQLYRIAAEEGMGIDAVSPGEIHTALSVGFPADRIFFHGDGKTDADIRYAVERRVGYFIVDNPDELQALAAEAGRQGVTQKVLLRVTPGIDPHTYKAISTGTVDVKCGVTIETGQAHAYQILLDDGHCFVFGYDETRDAERLFALNRIKNLVVSDVTFELPEEWPGYAELD